MADETPKTVTFQFAKDEETDSFLAQSELIGAAYRGDIEVPLPEMDKEERRAFGINMAAYGQMALNALGPTHLFWLTKNEKLKELTFRQKIWRLKRVIKRDIAQFLHDKTVKWGAYCDSDY